MILFITSGYTNPFSITTISIGLEWLDTNLQ